MRQYTDTVRNDKLMLRAEEVHNVRISERRDGAMYSNDVSVKSEIETK